jgi:hypothetical protein
LAKERARRAKCMSNLRQWGIALTLYAQDICTAGGWVRPIITITGAGPGSLNGTFLDWLDVTSFTAMDESSGRHHENSTDQPLKQVIRALDLFEGTTQPARCTKEEPPLS